MAGMITARQYLDNMQSQREQYAQDYGVDWWTKKKYDLDQGRPEFESYLSSGKTTAEDTARYRQQAQANYDSLNRDMDSYGSNSNRYKELKGYRDYYQNVLGALRQDDLQRSVNGFNGYYNEGKYTVEGNNKYRSEAQQAIKDLDEEMKGYSKDSEYYQMLDEYRNFYDNSLKVFDRTDAAASTIEYINADAWHSPEDFDIQKQLVQDNIDMLTQEMEASEDQESDEYKALAAYKEWYEGLLADLDTRKAQDDYFTETGKAKGVTGEENYVSWQKRNDYGYATQLGKTLKEKEEELKQLNPDYANLSDAAFNRLIKDAEQELEIAQAMAGPSDYDAAKKNYDDLVSAQELVGQINQLKKDQNVLRGHQANAILYEHYKGYDKNTDYQKLVDDLKEQLEKTEEGTEDYEKLQMQILAIAGVNGDGTNENGLYDEYTWLGRNIMEGFDAEAAEARLAKIKEDMRLVQEEINGLSMGVVSGDDVTDLNARYEELTTKQAALSAEKRDLQQKLNSSNNLKWRNQINENIAAVPPEEAANLIEAGKGVVKSTEATGGNTYTYYGEKAGFGVLPNFDALDDEYGAEIRDAIYMALGAKETGTDVGFTVDDVLKAYQGQINEIGGMKDAKKIDEMENGVARWIRQEIGVGLLGGVQRHFEHLPDFFTDEIRPDTRSDAKLAYTKQALGERYGEGSLPGGQNFSQMMLDVMDTTGNMLPGMLLSAGVGAGLGAAGGALGAAGKVAAGAKLAGAASTAGKIAGGLEMGISSGGRAYQQALKEGWAVEDARTYGAIIGTAESTMQYLISGIPGMVGMPGMAEEGLLRAAQMIDNTAVRIATKTAINIGSEVTEELAQNKLQSALDYYMFGKGDGDWMKWTEEDWNTVLVTVLSTALMEAGPQIKSDISATKTGQALAGGKELKPGLIESKGARARKLQINAIGEEMKGNEALAYTLETLAQDLDPDSEAYKLVEKANKHESAKTANYYGTLFNALLEDGGDPDKTMVAIIGGAQAYHLGNAAQETVKAEQAKLDALRKENPGATVLDATASKLMENGVRSSTEAAEMSVVVNKILSGKNLTKAEMQAVTGSSTAAKAARVALSEYNSTFTADMSPQVAESAVNYLTEDMRTKKNQERERLRGSVLQAAMNAASGLEKNRATAGADLGWRRGMTQGSIVQNAVGEKDTSWSTKGAAAQSVDAETAKKYVGAVRGRDVAADTLAKLRNTSFADLAVLSESEMAAMFGKSEAVALQGMIDRQAQLKNREASLLHSRFPTKAQKTELADIRQEMAELNTRAAGIIQSARQKAAQAAVEEKKAQAEAARNTTEEKPGAIPPKAAAQAPVQGDNDTVVLPGTKGATTTRAEFVERRVEAAKAAGKDVEAARADANRQFDDMVALTTGQEIGAEKGEDNNGRQQATDRDEARNDLGEQRDRAEDRERGDRSEQGAVGGNEAPRTRALSTASGKEAAKVTDGAVETTGENAAGLESKYPGVEKLAKYLMNSGVKRVVYVTDGQILNAVGEPVAGVYYDGEIFLNLNYKGGYHYSVTADHERMHARLALYKAALAERYGNDEAAQAKALAETREFVASALESILGEDTYADAFGKYWDSYAEPYMKAGAKPEDIMYMVCEEMLSDMVAGMNNFGAQLGIYANEANDFLETSHFDAAIKSIVAGENPTDLAYELPADNNMPFGLTFKELRPGDVKDAFKNETDTDAPPEQRPLPGDEPMHPELSLLSQQSLTEGTGLKLRYNDLGYVDAVIDPKTGEKVTEVTPEMMADTPLGKLVQDAIIKTDDNGKIISGHITQEQADAEYKLLADAMNLITRYNEAPLVWELVGSQLFSGVKKNSDTQYNYTIDFGTICRKTQAIVNVMSETMKYLGRGLSRREVEEVYLAVGKAREATPCPVCYVFSRWMGIGGLLDQINRYQNEYFDINQKTGEFTWKVDRQQVLNFMKEQEALAEQHVKDILKDKQAAVDKARAELEALSPNADEETRAKAEERLAKAEKSLENKRKDFLDENGYLKYGGILSDMKSNSAIDGAIQKINQLDQGDRLNEELLAKMDNASPEQQKKFLEIIKKNRQNKMAILKTYAPAERAAYDALAKEFNAINKKNKIKKDNFTAEQRAELDAAMLRATEAAKDGLDEALAAARAENDPVEKYQWLAKTVLSLKPGAKGERVWEFNEEYKPVKQEILFDLNKGADFARDYPLTWGFRTGKGCAMGKAIMPYSDARVGETLQGVASGETKGLINNNPFLNGEELQRADVVTKARAWARRQNLIGGMRYQSTSDFRFEWGSDYLITFFELQAIGANVQLYTKVIEAVDFLASTHSDCNLSVMPLGDGYVQVGTRQVGVDKNGKPILEPIYELAYSGVTGIDKDAALEKVHQYDNVQLILVGINDLNIRLALASEDVTFVIPFHGSGQSVHQVQTLMDLLGENLDVNKAQDYSDVQTDHFKKHRTDEEKAMWDLRMDIIMGNCLGGLTEKQQALIAKNKHLDKLHKMFYKQTENKAYHCFLAKEQASQIFPCEYWDTTTDYSTADRNGQIFQDYCASMGIIPRFSGKDSSGKDVGFGDFTKDKGYWKLLIDRKMYANTYDEATGEWTGYGNYRDQEKVTTDNIKIGMLDESTVAEGRGDWATATAIPEGARTKPIRSEKTQAIMMEAIYGTEDPDDKIQVTGIKNLEAARLNEIDRTKMTKGFRERYLDAKSELRNVPERSAQAEEVELTKDPVEELDGAKTVPLYSLRQEPAPQKTQWGFKLMTVDENGLPHAMFIDAAAPYEYGVWYNADSPKLENLLNLEPGYAYLVDADDNADMATRKPIRKVNGSFRGLPSKAEVNQATTDGKRWMVIDKYADGSVNVQNVGINGSGGISTFALRPGIHAVDIPSMAHIGAKSEGSKKIDTRRPNQRWFLIEYPVDNDYNQEAYSHRTKDIREHLPENGWYSFQTNSGAEARQHWFITGGMKIVGAVSEADIRKFAKERGFEQDLPWKQGKAYSEDDAIDLDEYIRTATAQPTPSKAEMRQRIEAERKQTKPVIPAKNALEKQAAAQPVYSIQEERPVDDVRDVGGNLVVEIDSKASGLNNYPKGQWSKILRDQIRRELVGRTILAEDGDLITFMDLSAREPNYGKAIKRDFEQARETGDYSKINRKQLTVDHLASLVSTSTFGRWDKNRDLDDAFKRDGLNHRDALIKIDGKYYDVDIATALNTDETDPENYGDKFYDIKISEAPSTKIRGALPSRTSPHKIRFVENTSDRLSVAQKDRAVKNAGVTFTSQGKAGGSAMSNAFTNAGKLRKSPQSLYSIAGPSASTANNEALQEAERRVGAGENAETVRKDTGWYRGTDGKWRFEIDNSEAFFDRAGHAAVTHRLREIAKQFTTSDEDIAEHERLVQQLMKAEKGHTVGDFLYHPSLFDAYPQLAKIELDYRKLGKNILGEYSPWQNRISISNSLRRNDAASMSVLLHELQHAIQRTEGFASGANASDVNYNTSPGEIEARDVQSRLYYSPEQRKQIPPDLGQGSLFSVQNTGSSEATPLYAEGSLESDLLDLVRMGPEAVSNFANEALANHEDALEAAKMHAPPIPSKGFVPDVTDSERGVLNRMLQQRIKEVGAQRPSEKSNGFLIPKGYKRFHQNVGSATNLPGYAHDLNLRQLMTTTEATYVRTSNKQLIKDAEEDVEELGYEGALAAYKRNAKSISLSTKDLLKTIALGEQLIHEAASNRDGANLLDVTASLALLGNVAGKSLQAFKLLKQMGPLGELYYVEKAINRINKENEDLIRHGKGKEIVAKKELCDAVLNAETEEDRNKAMDALIADLASQCPVTLRDRWNAWRYLAMLGNARTHIRNILGNLLFTPLRYVKDLVGAGGEFLATKAGWMEEADRRKAIVIPRELRDFAREDAEVYKRELQGNGKYNPAQEILSRRRILPGVLDTVSRINSEGYQGENAILRKLLPGLEGEDWMSLKPAYARALAMQLTHLGYSIDELRGSPEGQKALNEARKIAIEEAQKATYRDFCAVASWLNRGKQMKGAAGTIVSIGLEGVLPFTKTPINILRRGVEYSPLGIIKGIGTILDGVRSGEVDVAEAIDQLAAGLSGTAIAAVGWLLARMGVLRGKKSDDDEENFDKLQGYQDYSLQIGDQSFTIDWMAPTALPLFTGAAIADLMDEDHELSWGDAWNAMIMIAEPMTSLSMLDGLNKLIESTAYASGNEKIATIATQAATSYLGQAFPTILGQVARSIDGTRRSTYIDKNSPIPAAGQRFVQSSVQNKIPGWESAKVPYIDAWGRQSEAGSKVLNGIENFFMPYYRSVKNTTDVDEELQRLYKATKADVLPSVPQKYFSIGDNQKKYLTADEWVSYATDVGQTKYKLMTQLISDPRYLALTDAEKAKVIKDYIYKYATTAGKFHVYSDYDIRHQGVWIQEAEAAATDSARFERIWQQIEKGLKD